MPGHPFMLGLDHWAVAGFVLALTFLSGMLGGFFFGLTRAFRHGDGGQEPRSIWTYEDES